MKPYSKVPRSCFKCSLPKYALDIPVHEELFGPDCESAARDNLREFSCYLALDLDYRHPCIAFLNARCSTMQNFWKPELRMEWITSRSAVSELPNAAYVVLALLRE